MVDYGLPPRWPAGWPISRTVQIYRGISAHNTDANPSITAYAIGDDGTESGHTLGTEDTARAISGAGVDVDVFVRMKGTELTNSDLTLNHLYKLQFQIDAGGWNDLTGASTGCIFFNSSNITHGADTTDRLTGSEAFITNNNGVVNNNGSMNATLLWVKNSSEADFLFAVRLVDADLTSDVALTFRVVHGAGSDRTEGTTVPMDVTPTINWTATPIVDDPPTRRHPDHLNYMRY